ncbi:Hypothetical predicted protein [Octopus vulgaris]|uniref:Uncharacterized protein n=1 Tax=Octopus vulgaris TaxID=6645 RepID=A0AA36AP11_OCTVU|nr:Hypothetical predicted protein [Octopus vulgaris]
MRVYSSQLVKIVIQLTALSQSTNSKVIEFYEVLHSEVFIVPNMMLAAETGDLLQHIMLQVITFLVFPLSQNNAIQNVVQKLQRRKSLPKEITPQPFHSDRMAFNIDIRYYTYKR